MDNHCANRQGVQRGAAPCSGFPMGPVAPLLATSFSPESLVYYTFVEQMAAGIVAR